MADFIAEVPQQVDGASWLLGSRVGLLLQSLIGEQLEQAI